MAKFFEEFVEQGREALDTEMEFSFTSESGRRVPERMFEATRVGMDAYQGIQDLRMVNELREYEMRRARRSTSIRLLEIGGSILRRIFI